MNDELDALLRDHYRAAADDVHAGPEAIRRFQAAGRDVRPAPRRPLRSAAGRWALPALAAALTAAVLVAMAVFAWPGEEEPDPPRPLAPATSPAPAQPPSPSETRAQVPETSTGGVPVPSSSGVPVPTVPSAVPRGSR